jgi:hypothetical protein
MKKLAFAVLLAASSYAQATGLYVVNGADIKFSGYDGEPVTYTGERSFGQTGEIWASVAGNLEAVYLGQESGNANRFRFEVGNFLNESNTPGDTIYTIVPTAPALLNFRFRDITDGETFINGSTSNFAIMSGALGSPLFEDFDYILGFNDNRIGGDADYDDFVVGLRFTPETSEVPVPAALPLMASALGMFGVARRRKQV